MRSTQTARGRTSLVKSVISLRIAQCPCDQLLIRVILRIGQISHIFFFLLAKYIFNTKVLSNINLNFILYFRQLICKYSKLNLMK